MGFLDHRIYVYTVLSLINAMTDDSISLIYSHVIDDIMWINA